MRKYIYVDTNGKYGNFCTKASLPLNVWMNFGASIVKIIGEV
jgi:hypothetical protein